MHILTRALVLLLLSFGVCNAAAADLSAVWMTSIQLAFQPASTSQPPDLSLPTTMKLSRLADLAGEVSGAVIWGCSRSWSNRVEPRLGHATRKAEAHECCQADVGGATGASTPGRESSDERLSTRTFARP